jgi:filamentous hemagglutinin family protein
MVSGGGAATSSANRERNMQFALARERFCLRRGFLIGSTALSAILSPLVAVAQIAPSTTPQGGVVVGGSASIAQAPGSTTINQSSERGAINWQSFDVGSAAKVQFNQPDAAAVTLNRVTGGNLSQINGQINANGQVVLINQSGVVFGKGSQVNAESVVVSTSDIATSDFMAGKMNFSGTPQPGAKIINDGNITARNAGLVGLIAPQVANNGVITAELGQVVLAGAAAFTLDLYGDRLISLDVTQAVRAVDVGGKPVAALVTNSGLIIADGGKVTMTAADADALVTQLIDAGGTIRADTAAGQTGTISVTGVGGNISGADIDVSGAAGGGYAAIGTDLARAQTGPSDTAAPAAASVLIASGATIHTDATQSGNAGTVTLLSRNDTDFAGAITAQGGPQGGNGGLSEISSHGVISLSGTVLATAIDGQPGEILLDPQTLIVTIGGDTEGTFSNGATTFGDTGSTPTTSLIDPAELNSLQGEVVLEAADLVSVASAIDMVSAGNELTLFSDGAVDINAPITVFDGDLEIDAGTRIDVGAALNALDVLLDGGSGATRIEAPVVATGEVELGGSGSVFESGAGQITTPELASYGYVGGDVFLTAANNSIAAIGFSIRGNFEGGFSAFGTFVLDDQIPLAINTYLQAADVTLAAPTITVDGYVYAGLINDDIPVQEAEPLVPRPTILAIAADAITLTGAQALEAPGGTIEVAPYSLAGIDVNGTNATALDLSANFFADLDTAAVELQLGRAAQYDAAFVTLEGDLALQNQELVLAATSQILDPGTVDMTGTVATVAIDGGGLSQGKNGQIITNVLQGDGLPITGDVLLSSELNSISTLAAISLSNAAELQLVDATPLLIDGLVSTAGDVDLTGSAGPVAIDETANGLIYAGTLTGGTSTGEVFLGSAGNLIGTLGGIGVGSDGTLIVNDGESLMIGGLVTAGGEVLLGAPGIGEVAGGDIVSGELAGYTNIAGNVALTQPNDVARLGPFDAGGAFDLDNAIPLSVIGSLIAQDVLIAAPSIAVGQPIAAGSAPDPGVLALAGDAMSVTGGGALRAPGGTIELAPYSSGNGIDVNGTGGDLNLSAAFLAALDTDAAEILLGQAGPYQAANITLEGIAAVSNPLLVLATPGEITDSGRLSANTLEFNGAGFTQSETAAIQAGLLQGDGAPITGDVRLGNAGNHIGTLGAVALGNFSLDLNDGTALTVTGPATARNITLDDSAGIFLAGQVVALNRLFIQDEGVLTQSGGNISAATATLDSAGGISLDGNSNVAGDLVLNAQGDILHQSGRLVAGTLAGSADGLASFDAYTNFATIGSFIDGAGLVVLDNSGPLTLAGPLVAGALSLAVDGLLTLDGSPTGGLFLTGGASSFGQNAVTASAGIVQSGTFFINAGPLFGDYLGAGNQAAALVLSTPGNIAFANGPQGLDAPSTNLLLNAGGFITGNVVLQGVTILNAQATQLFGSLDGVTGTAAAALGFVEPAPAITQLFNDCEIETDLCAPPQQTAATGIDVLVNEILFSLQTGIPDSNILFNQLIPSGIVLPQIDIGSNTKRRLHPDVQLPGVANADF